MYSGYILDPKKRFSVWKSADVSPRLDPLLREVNYKKRIAGYKKFDEWAVEQGYAFPLLGGVAAVGLLQADWLQALPKRLDPPILLDSHVRCGWPVTG